MRHLRKCLLSLFACILMVLSLLPIQPAYADTTGEIDFIDFGNTTSLASPYQANNGTINFSVSFSNINPTSLTYTVQQVTSSGSATTTPSVSGSVQPQNLQPQNSPTQAEFTNVPLFEGLNMITVSGQLSSSTQSANTSSGLVTRTAYVNYLNVPIISSVDAGTTKNLTSSNNVAYVTGSGSTGNTSFTVYSQNANQLSITENGKSINSTATINPIGSPVNEFVVTNVSLNPGENDFVFSATNSIRSTVTNLAIKVIYFNNQPIVYNLTGQFGSSSSSSVPINPGQPISVTGSTTLQSITGGEVLIPNSTGVTINSPMTVTLLDSNKTSIGTYQLTPTVDSSLGSSNPFLAYKISDSGPDTQGSVASGTYTLQFNVTSGGTTNSFSLPFTVQNSNNLNNPTFYQLGGTGTWSNGSSNFSAGSATPVSGTVNKQQGPLYLDLAFSNSKTTVTSSTYVGLTNITVNTNSIPVLQIGNNIYVQLVDTSGHNYIDTTQSATAQPNLNWSWMSSEVLSGGIDLTGTMGLQIDHIPTGSYNLNVYDGSQNNALVQSVTINNFNAPSIQLTNAYNGEIFNSPTQSITVQANNFDSTPGTMNLTLNGVSQSASSVSGNQFTFGSLTLTNGPNHLVFTAQNGATTIEADFTLYYYGNNMPVVGVQPSGITATLDSGLQTPVTNTGNNTYSTNGSTVTIQGNFKNAASMTVQVNGQYEFGDTSSTNTISTTSAISGRSYTNSSGQSIGTLNITSPVPIDSTNTLYSGSFSVTQQIKNGQTAFTFTVFDKSGNQSQVVITITKGSLPFTVVSPSMAMNGSYTTGQTISYGPYDTNQNFIDLIIQTSTADSVTIGKNTAAIIQQDTTNGVTKYGTEIQNLKPGTNTIPVQITSGTNKTKGSIIINYLNQNIVGAQNRVLMPTSGKVSAFNGLVQLQFPKNTVFQQQSDPGQAPANPALFANQTILFGIANTNTGEITTQPNTSTSYTGQSSSYSTLKSVISSMIPLGYSDNFSYASNLFWIDAGDPNQQTTSDTSGNTFIPAGGLDPYYPYNLDASSYWNNASSQVQGQQLAYNYRTSSTSDWLQPTSPGTITLQYDPNIRNIDTLGLTVMYLDHSGSWVKIGGTVNTSQHSITAPFQGFGYYVVTNVDSKYSDLNSFVDSGDQSWARTYLNIMLAKGMMVPESGTYFGVTDTITRGEFAEILVKALNLPLNYDSQASFDDVPYSASTVQNIGQLWSYPYIETAARAGIVKGISSRVFGPNLPLTRQDAAVMIARAANFKMALDPNVAITALQKVYTDAGSINPYAAPGVLAVYKAKIMTGNPTTPGAMKTTYYFGPTNNLLRSEAAVIAVHLMQQLKLLPTTL